MSACADHVHLIVRGVDSSFHGLTSGNFLGNFHITTRPHTRIIPDSDSPKMTNPCKPDQSSQGFGSLCTGGSYSVRDEATGPQENGPVTDNGPCKINNGRFSIRPPHAVYCSNSFFLDHLLLQ